MTSQHVEVRHGQYHDSVTLLAVSRTVSGVEGIDAAQIAMATPLNLDVLSTMGFDLPQVSPDDLIVALRFENVLDESGVDTARAIAAIPLLLLSVMLILVSQQITFESFGTDLLTNLGNFTQWMMELVAQLRVTIGV